MINRINLSEILKGFYFIYLIYFTSIFNLLTYRKVMEALIYCIGKAITPTASGDEKDIAVRFKFFYFGFIEI